jgi:nitrile hydratase accessory protein
LSRPEPPLPPGADEPAFAEPWQARAFALAVQLQATGAFSWSDWAAALGAELARDGSDYHRAWLGALEGLLAERGIVPPEAVAATAERWQRAAAATPHGTPISLEAAPEH